MNQKKTKKNKIETSPDLLKNNSTLYLDLLQNSLLGLIEQDPPFSRFGAKEFDIESRINGLDWPTRAYTMIGLKRLYNSRILAETIIQEKVKGDFFEAGVWRGGASIMMRGVLSAYGITDRCVWLADSFEGLPPPDECAYPQDADSLFHTYPELSVSMEQVQENFQKFNLLDEQVVFLKGWFKDTLYDSSVQAISLLRLDGDLYESTMQALDALYDKVSHNGYVIIDDYHCVPQCKQAILDFFTKRKIHPELNEIDGVGVYWKKLSSLANNTSLDPSPYPEKVSGFRKEIVDNPLPQSNLFQQMTTLYVQLSLRDARLVESNKQLAERDTRLTETNTQLAERDERIAESNRQLAERDARISERDARISERDARIADTTAQLAERDARLAERNLQIQELMNWVDAIHGSTSWRITAPLRFISELRRSITGKNRGGHILWRDRIKNRLVAYPLLYKLMGNLYHRMRRNSPGTVHTHDGTNFSRLHISRDQGLLTVTQTESGEIIKSAPSFLAHYEADQDFSNHATDIKAIAYHLPQFHAIPENDEWWGEGFTEWTNTRKTKPLFPGHYQPREPHDDIGYYDLSDIETLKQQVKLAKKHGIYGFCFYHYWFHGKRLLGKPVDLLLDHPEIDMPFCLCWANETWSKRWDGMDHHILMHQTFSAKDDIDFISFLKPYMMDSRYIRVAGKPMLLVYRISKFSDPEATVKRWRKWCRENGVGEIHLVAVCHGEVYPRMPLHEVGFDAYAAFPPHGFSCQHISSDKDMFGTGYRFDYASGIESYTFSKMNTPVYEGCTLGWDNTARFGENANIYMNFSLDCYSSWLRKVIEYTRTRFKPEDRYLFINAWNEWAEGAYLEPDKKYGYASINATSRALFDLSDTDLDEASLPQQTLETADRYTKDYEWLKSMINSKGEHSLAVAAQFIPLGAEILEFGSAAGYFTRFLKQERNATVDIVELDKACAEKASQYARDFHIGDIEQGGWKDIYADRQYDIILFADVLEHLRDPWRVLTEAARQLKPGGRIILSVPNIAHAQILSSLYNDDFSYAQVGILDKTHLRFFTEQTIRQMAEDCGLRVCDLIPVIAKILPTGCGTLWNRSQVPTELKTLLSSKPNAHAIQFVLCCTRTDHDAG